MIKALTGKPFFQSASMKGWGLGLHVHLQSPNIEIHLPGGFLRVGWVKQYWGDDE